MRPAHVKIRCVEGTGQDGRVMRLIGTEFWFGRSPQCSLPFPGDVVSRKHACFKLLADRWIVRDHNSSNGTLVNGRKIEIAPLQLGDQVRFGEAGPVLLILGLELGGGEVDDLEATRMHVAPSADLPLPAAPPPPPPTPTPEPPAPAPAEPAPAAPAADFGAVRFESMDDPVSDTNATRPLGRVRPPSPEPDPPATPPAAPPPLPANATMPLPLRSAPAEYGPWAALLGLFLGAATGVAAWGQGFPYRAVGAPVFWLTGAMENRFAGFVEPRLGWVLLAGLAVYGALAGAALQRPVRRWPLLVALLAFHAFAVMS